MDEQDLMRKVQALLAKAEGTDNEHEADAFFAKANDLMVRYAIDEERVRAEMRRTRNGVIEEPVVEDYMFSSYAHHATAKQQLFQTVAKTQSVRSFPYSNRKDSNYSRVHAAGLTGLHESQWTKLIGYKSDIEHAKILYLSLLIQSQKYANADWRVRYGKDAKHSSWEDGRVGKFTWLSAHMEGFADRIDERFREIREAIIIETNSSALMLDKDANILEWMYEHGYAIRPKNYQTCYAWEPASLAPIVKTGKNKGQPNSKWHPRGCSIKVINLDEPHPHRYTVVYDWSYRSSSSLSTKQRGSHEGTQAGRESANRADIGLSRVGSASKQIGGN